MASRPSLLRRLTLSVVLPLALLFAQQGGLLHEWSHWHPGAAGAEERVGASSAADLDMCLTCLGFAQIAGLAKFDVAASPAAPELRYHFLAQAFGDVAEAAIPAARSRGPPLFPSS